MSKSMLYVCGKMNTGIEFTAEVEIESHPKTTLRQLKESARGYINRSQENGAVVETIEVVGVNIPPAGWVTPGTETEVRDPLFYDIQEVLNSIDLAYHLKRTLVKIASVKKMDADKLEHDIKLIAPEIMESELGPFWGQWLKDNGCL